MFFSVNKFQAEVVHSKTTELVHLKVTENTSTGTKGKKEPVIHFMRLKFQDGVYDYRSREIVASTQFQRQHLMLSARNLKFERKIKFRSQLKQLSVALEIFLTRQKLAKTRTRAQVEKFYRNK